MWRSEHPFDLYWDNQSQVFPCVQWLVKTECPKINVTSGNMKINCVNLSLILPYYIQWLELGLKYINKISSVTVNCSTGDGSAWLKVIENRKQKFGSSTVWFVWGVCVCFSLLQCFPCLRLFKSSWEQKIKYMLAEFPVAKEAKSSLIPKGFP